MRRRVLVDIHAVASLKGASELGDWDGLLGLLLLQCQLGPSAAEEGHDKEDDEDDDEGDDRRAYGVVVVALCTQVWRGSRGYFHVSLSIAMALLDEEG